MKKQNFRIKDDPEIWSKVPRNADDAFDHYYLKLIEENSAIMALAEKKECGPYDEPVRKKLNPAQVVLVLIYRLDSQILNGGITQFYWNAIHESEDVKKAISKLGQVDLAKLYAKADAQVEGKLKEFETLYIKGHEIGGEIGKKCFFDTYALLGLKWFDKAYLAKNRTKLVKALLEFVVKNKAEFVS